MSKSLKALAVCSTLLVAACGSAYDFDDLERLDVRGDGFAAAIGREYREFALFEKNEMGDSADADVFLRKALLSALGETVEPEAPGDWVLPAEHKGEVELAHGRLRAVLAGGGREQAPRVAARAQAGFDCWVEQLEENFQPDHIAHCRNQFEAALSALERSLGLSAGPIPAPQPALVRGGGAVAPATEALSFTIFFAFDAADLSETDDETVDAVIEAVGGGRPVHLNLDGHADRAGGPAYNRALSARRAEAVRQALVERGLEPEQLSVRAHGEERPRVATPDGAREPRNRRVEITILPAAAL